jgi:hypothetical protein
MLENEKIIEGVKMLHNNVKKLSQDVKRYLLKHKSDVVDTIEIEFGEDMSERLDNSLTDIKEKIINLAYYFDDEINYDRVPQTARGIFVDLEKRARQILDLMEELSEENKFEFKDEIIKEFIDEFMPQIDEIYEIATDTLNDIK